MATIRSGVKILSDVLFAGRLTVPWHQRYFDWNEEQVQELLDDITGAFERDMQCYFLGSVMLVESENDTDWEVNDGQQRMVTLSLLIAALCRRFEAVGDGQNVTVALRALFDRPASQASRMADVNCYQPRIRLSRTDKAVYAQIIRGNSVGSNGRLVAAFDVIEQVVHKVPPDVVGSLFNYVMRRLELAVLTIPNDVDINSFFEALNARGKPLDDVDLIRNRFYSYFSGNDQAVRRETVHDCLERVAVVAERKVEAYYRCYLQCQYGYLQKKRLYRDTRKYIEAIKGDATSHVYKVVEGMQSHVELYRTIASSGASPKFRKHFPMVQDSADQWMHDLRRYTVSHPVIFALFSRLLREPSHTMGEAKRLVRRSLDNLTSFVLRTSFVTAKFEPSKLDESFGGLAKRIFGGDTLESLDVMDYLDSNDNMGITSDSGFVRQLQVVQLRDNRRALALLFGINTIEQDLSAIRRNGCSVEHVLPKSSDHWAGWSGFGPDQRRDYVFRIGNMVVLSKGENRADSKFNACYDEKRNLFRDSTLVMARDVGRRYAEWTPSVIEDRCTELARSAAKAWKFVRGRLRQQT